MTDIFPRDFCSKCRSDKPIVHWSTGGHVDDDGRWQQDYAEHLCADCSRAKLDESIEWFRERMKKRKAQGHSDAGRIVGD